MHKLEEFKMIRIKNNSIYLSNGFAITMPRRKEDKSGFIRLLEEIARIQSERKEYESYVYEGGNLSIHDWKKQIYINKKI